MEEKYIYCVSERIIKRKCVSKAITGNKLRHKNRQTETLKNC